MHINTDCTLLCTFKGTELWQSIVACWQYSLHAISSLASKCLTHFQKHDLSQYNIQHASIYRDGNTMDDTQVISVLPQWQDLNIGQTTWLGHDKWNNAKNHHSVFRYCSSLSCSVQYCSMLQYYSHHFNSHQQSHYCNWMPSYTVYSHYTPGRGKIVPRNII